MICHNKPGWFIVHIKGLQIRVSKLQSNLVNPKSKGLEILFRSIEISKYREVDMRTCNPTKNDYHQCCDDIPNYGRHQRK